MKNKNFFLELPEGYKADKILDAKSVKMGVLFTVVNAIVVVIIVALGAQFIDFREAYSSISYPLSTIYMSTFVLTLIAYIVLHELTHGLFYKIFTHQKLTFGISLTCAYCGVPNLYIKKVPMLITCLAPFVIFTIIGLVALVLVADIAAKALILIIFAVHVGGCVGDLYVTLIMLFKYKGDLLINDTGAVQTFYVKE